MAAGLERIVVQVTPEDKEVIVEKAKRLGLSVAELMRRGAMAYECAEADGALDALAYRAMQAADRATASIDEMLVFVAASNSRIAKMKTCVDE